MPSHQDALSQGALPPNPRDICTTMKGRDIFQPFIFAPNIPAGGSDAAHPRHAAGPGAQNSSFKNFSGPGANA